MLDYLFNFRMADDKMDKCKALIVKTDCGKNGEVHILFLESVS